MAEHINLLDIIHEAEQNTAETKNDTIEQQLKDLIISKYGSMQKFCTTIKIPWSTLDSLLKRGVQNGNIGTIMSICMELDISCEALYHGDIVPNKSTVQSQYADFMMQLHRSMPPEQVVDCYIGLEELRLERNEMVHGQKHWNELRKRMMAYAERLIKADMLQKQLEEMDEQTLATSQEGDDTDETT